MEILIFASPLLIAVVVFIIHKILFRRKLKQEFERMQQKYEEQGKKFIADMDKTLAEIDNEEDEKIIEQKLNDLLKRHELDDESIQKVIHSSKTENKKPDKKSSPFLD